MCVCGAANLSDAGDRLWLMCDFELSGVAEMAEYVGSTGLTQ